MLVANFARGRITSILSPTPLVYIYLILFIDFVLQQTNLAGSSFVNILITVTLLALKNITKKQRILKLRFQFFVMSHLRIFYYVTLLLLAACALIVLSALVMLMRHLRTNGDFFSSPLYHLYHKYSLPT